MKDILNTIERIRQGDELAFRHLLNAHHKMIYSIINSFELESGDYAIDKHDLYQEGSISLYEAVFTFEEDRNVKFSSYAYMVIRSKIINVLRNYYKTYNEETYSIDALDYNDFLRSLTVRDVPFEYHKQQEFISEFQKVLNGLSSEDKRIIELRNKRYSYKQISEVLNIKVKRVDNRISSLKKLFKNLLEKDYEEEPT